MQPHVCFSKTRIGSVLSLELFSLTKTDKVTGKIKK